MSAQPVHPAPGLPSDVFSAVDSLPLGILALDPDFRIVFWNTCLESWTSRQRGSLLGHDIRSLFPAFSKPLVAGRVKELFGAGPPAIFSYHLHNYLVPAPLPGGGWRLQHSMAYGLRDALGQVTHVMFSFQDVTEIHNRLQENLRVQARLEKEVAQRKRVEAKLLELATVDMLTGIYNRRAFMRSLSKEVRRAHRYGHALSVVSMDIDHFKQVNDNHGHLAGDDLLRVVAQTCGEEIRDMDILGRVGGEEFGLVLPETDGPAALAVAGRICLRIAATRVQRDGATISCTASFGVSALKPRQNLEEILHVADQALYEAKNQGRNRCVLI